MTLEEEYELSFYEEMGILKEGKDAWLVRHVESGKMYVRKKIKKYNKELIFRLMNLDIHDIPKIYLCIENDDDLTIIEEYIHGDNLYDIQKKDGIFDCERAVNVIMALCDILSQLHGLKPPVIHRDIKPTNVMISSDGVVKLIDFDAARENTDGENSDTYLMGTREYAAPEQYGFRQSDARTDIYALGVLLNTMLTGSVPKKEIYSGNVKKIIEKCTKMEPDERYTSVEQLKHALEQAANGKEYKSARYIPVGYRTRTLWKCLVATGGYVLIMWLGFTVEFKNNDGTPYTKSATFYYRICVVLMMLGVVMLAGNYIGIRDRLPGMNKNPFTNRILCVGYGIIYCFMIVFIFVMLQPAFGV